MRTKERKYLKLLALPFGTSQAMSVCSGVVTACYIVTNGVDFICTVWGVSQVSERVTHVAAFFVPAASGAWQIG